MTMTIKDGADFPTTVQNARWHPDVSRRITHRIVVEGTLVLQTPAHFGMGDSDGTELLILRDALTGQPLLPGASITGALRQYLRVRERGFRKKEADDDKQNHTLAAALFGMALDNDTGTQSRLIVDDALGQGGVVDARDGVKIDGKTRTAEDQKLYTFQVWQPGTRFELRFELCLYAEDTESHRDALKTGLAVALDALSKGEIPLGARKHRGYGQAKVENWRVVTFDLTNVPGLLDWVGYGGAGLANLDVKPVPTVAAGLNISGELDDHRHRIEVTGTFRLLDSLLIRAGSDVVDDVHLHQQGAEGQRIPLLSGTSLTGALRARAVKILNTLAPSIDDQHRLSDLIDAMFGAFGEDKDAVRRLISANGQPQKRTASALIAHESRIESAHVFDRVQNRVKIDRFTGGAFDTGLFAQQPLFATDETTLEIRLELRFPAYVKHLPLQEQQQERRVQGGLLLMVLKDLWTGDLPLGGESSIGRGRLEGQRLEITIRDGEHQEDVTITAGEKDTLSVSHPDVLESYVDALRRKAGVR